MNFTDPEQMDAQDASEVTGAIVEVLETEIGEELARLLEAVGKAEVAFPETEVELAEALTSELAAPVDRTEVELTAAKTVEMAETVEV